VRLWDATSGQELRSLQGHTREVSAVAFSPDGTCLASADYGGLVRLWDCRTGQELRTLSHGGTVYGVAFSPDGTSLASASDDRTVRLWDTATGQELFSMKGHTGAVISVAFSADGTRLASASGDKTVRLWDTSSGQELRTFKGHTDPVYRVAFSPDSTQIASAGQDATVRFWDARPLSPEVRVEREALGLLDTLFHRPRLKVEVFDYLRACRTIPETVRTEALRLAERYHDEPVRFNQASWAVVRRPGLPPERYRQALAWAETARRLGSLWTFVNTFGVAQYRAGRYEEALHTLRQADWLNRCWLQPSQPADLAFLAMTEHQLGHKDQAQDYLRRLRDTMKQTQWANNEKMQGFLREAETLLALPGSQP
jgi:hypothetical protein